jgi:hypothetical protein
VAGDLESTCSRAGVCAFLADKLAGSAGCKEGPVTLESKARSYGCRLSCAGCQDRDDVKIAIMLRWPGGAPAVRSLCAMIHVDSSRTFLKRGLLLALGWKLREASAARPPPWRRGSKRRVCLLGRSSLVLSCPQPLRLAMKSQSRIESPSGREELWSASRRGLAPSACTVDIRGHNAAGSFRYCGSSASRKPLAPRTRLLRAPAER